MGRDTSVVTDDVWIADSTPVECGRSRPPALSGAKADERLVLLDILTDPMLAEQVVGPGTVGLPRDADCPTRVGQSREETTSATPTGRPLESFIQ